jgi:hypothetical protein
MQDRILVCSCDDRTRDNAFTLVHLIVRIHLSRNAKLQGLFPLQGPPWFAFYARVYAKGLSSHRPLQKYLFNEK